ncbi:MAG: LysM domain-containing protein [Alphaproteobacteria bacterium]|nr:MAG: LysM domain-containing protein [Alphaproteobacteria bacterium]
MDHFGSNRFAYSPGRHVGLAAGLSAAVMLSACGGKHEAIEMPAVAPTTSTASLAVPTPQVVVPTPAVAADERFTLILGLLSQGKVAQARVDLVQYLEDRPRDGRARDMLRQIDTDPTILYGTASFPYTIGDDDSLASIARRFMGSPYRFYGLAKFNALSVPADAKPGQIIRVPGRPYAVPPRRPRAAAQQHEAAPGTPTTVARPVVDRAGGQRLRRAGLEQMSAGSIDRAVTLLERAAALDPGNGAIASDLARGRRIQSAVRSRN